MASSCWSAVGAFVSAEYTSRAAPTVKAESSDTQVSNEATPVNKSVYRSIKVTRFAYAIARLSVITDNALVTSGAQRVIRSPG